MTRSLVLNKILVNSYDALCLEYKHYVDVLDHLNIHQDRTTTQTKS